MNIAILPIDKYLYRQYVHCAERRNIAFKLTIQEFLKLIDCPCVYCGAVGSNSAYRKQYAVKQRHYNGIDRVNSSLPYDISNTVSCCGECNAAKSNMTLESFLSTEWIVRRRQALANLGK